MKNKVRLLLALSVLFGSIIAIYASCARRPAMRPMAMASPTTTSTAVSTGPGGACPLGWVQSDTNVSTCSMAFGWTPGLADGGAFNIPLPSMQLYPQDDSFMTAAVDIETPNAIDSTGHAWFRIKWGLTYQTDGSFADPSGALAPTAVDSQVGSQLTNTTVTAVRVGNQYELQVTCTALCAARGNVDYTRGALAPWVLSVSPDSGSALPGAPINVTITTTPGAAQYATGGTLNGNALSNCTPTSGNTVTCSLSAGSYAIGTGSVCITSQANPFCLPNGWAFYDGGAGGSSSGGSSSGGSSSGGDSGSDGGSDAGSDGGSDGGTGPLLAACCTGGTLMAEYEGYSNNHTGSTAGTWTDLSGNGQTLPVVGSPTYNASGSTPTVHPTISISPSNYFEISSFTFGAGGEAVSICAWAKTATTGPAEIVSTGLTNSVELRISNSSANDIEYVNNAGTVSTWGSTSLSAWHVWCGSTTGGVSGSALVEQDNGSPVTTTISSGGTSTAATSTLDVGARNGGGVSTTMEIAGFIVCNGSAVLNSTQLTCIQNAVTAYYGGI